MGTSLLNLLSVVASVMHLCENAIGDNLNETKVSKDYRSSSYGIFNGTEVWVEIEGTPMIDEDKQTITLEMVIYLGWADKSLKDFPMILHPSAYDKIWTPDIYISINKKIILRPPITQSSVEQILISKIRESSNQSQSEWWVIYSTRITPTIGCKMDFSRYPADVQNCDLEFICADENSNKVRWFNEEVEYSGDYDSPNYSLNFTSVLYPTENFFRYRAVGSTITFSFSRKIGFHILQTYLPSMIFIIVTFFCVFIPIGNMSDRLVLCTSMLLTLTALFGSVRQASPSVSYIKALDIWMVACVSFVFLVMAENVIVVNISRGNVGMGILRLIGLVPSDCRRKKCCFQTAIKGYSAACYKFWKRESSSSSIVLEKFRRRGHSVYEVETSENLNELAFTTSELFSKAAEKIDKIARFLLLSSFCGFTSWYIFWLLSVTPT